MVSRKTHKSKAVAKQKKSRWWLFALLGFLVAGITVAVGLLVKELLLKTEVKPPVEEVEVVQVDIPDKDLVPDEVVEPEISFQNLVDEWVKTVQGNESVLIYDLENDKVVGEYNADETYATASLYKLFVVYEGYRRLQSGEWQSEDAAGATGHTILECLDLAIRESHSPCAETLWGKIGRDELDRIVQEDFKILNSDIKQLDSNARDITEMMKIYYQHNEITDAGLIDRMKDSFLNQPVTTYNWRQGLPSGFTKAKVYNKVGWDYNAEKRYWNIYHDAAIVEFPEDDRHFIVVVMTNYVPFEKIRELGTEVEQAYYNT